MTKSEFRIGKLVGVMLGTMALVILSFSVFMNKMEEVMLLGEQIKINLIREAEGICDESYPIVIATIKQDGTVITECRTE